MNEKEKSEQEPSENESINEPELMSLMDDMKNVLDDEDEIIELTDADAVEVAGVIKPEEEDDDEIIELTDAEDEIIELADADTVEVAGVVKNVENDQDIIIKDPEEDIYSEEYVKDDFAASLGMEINSESDSPDGLIENEELDLETKTQKEFGELSVSSQQVEAAVERVVQRILGDKIDSILIEVIERAVTQEIIRLKNVLRVNENDFD